MNKKADLLNNALGAILAIGILLIFFFGVRELYKQATNDEKNAQTMLDKIIIKIEALKEGESTTMDIVGTKGEWYLTAWDVTNGPDKCFPDNCLCVCSGTTKEICQDKGICREFEEKIGVVTIKEHIYVQTDEGREVFSSKNEERVNGIAIKQKEDVPLKSLNISKKEKLILITTVEELKNIEPARQIIPPGAGV